MKVLWITNTIFPDLCNKINIPVPFVGGWMHAGAKSLIESNKDIELAVVSFYNDMLLAEYKINDIQYFLVPNIKKNSVYNKDLEKCFIEIKNRFHPDIVHIHGSEYPHSLACLNAYGSHHLVVSIQGLVSVYERYYLSGIHLIETIKNITLRDIIRNDSIFQQKSRLKSRGYFEQELIRKSQNIIGRTSWDKSHVFALNSNANYFFCNESLRPTFYNKDWKFEFCEPYSIFISQAHYPIKGIHILLKALPIIITRFPEVKVYVAGSTILNKRKFFQSGYSSYISKLIKNLKLSNHLVFLGELNEEQMAESYCKSNVFVCPSAIENSPNSVGEAQLVGTPCIASYTGGTMDMIENGKTGLLYRFEEVEMLAECLNMIFSDQLLASELSKNGKLVAKERHDKIKNTRTLIEIYNKICKN